MHGTMMQSDPGRAMRILPARLLIVVFSLLVACAAPSPAVPVSHPSAAAQKKLDEADQWSKQRQFKQAEAVYREVLQSGGLPDQVKAWIGLGDLYFSIQSYDEALDAFGRALALDPNAYKARAGSWATRLQQSSLAPAVKRQVGQEIDAYINQAPHHPDVADYLYAAYEGLDDLQEDERKAEIRARIVRANPDPENLKSLSEDALEEIVGQTDIPKRLAMIDDYFRLFPRSYYSNLVHQIQLGILAEDLKDRGKLREEGEKWIAQEPDNRKAYFWLGYWLTGNEWDLERAVTVLQKALELIQHPDPMDRPENQTDQDWNHDLQIEKGHYYDTLGWALLKNGQFLEAKENFDNAKELLNVDYSLFYHLGVFYEQQSHRYAQKDYRDEAVKAYLRSVEAGDTIPEVSRSLERLAAPSGSSGENLHAYFARKKGVTTFTDVTEKAGLGSVKGRRVAWGDYNGDGYDDLLVDGHRLFRNNRDGTFTAVTAMAGLNGVVGVAGGVWADFNNDGHLDFYMMASGNGSSHGRFWRNNGDGTFTDITKTAVPRMGEEPTEGAGWGDYNGDGWVDLYLANYEIPRSRAVQLGIGTRDVLWRNNRDGTFTDVTKEAGLSTLEPMNGRGVNWGDFNNDGLLDIFVSNYRLDPNFLWRNNGDGTFTNVAREQGVEGLEKEGYYGNTIGSEWGDYNNDGNLDLFSANLAHPRNIGVSDKSLLFENSGPPFYRFRDRRNEAGIRYQESDSEPSFGDFDNDGNQDLFLTAVYPQGKSMLYRNDGNGGFEDITWLAGVRVSNSWTSAYADFDRDGDLDLAVGSDDGIRLFANDGNSNHWLQVRVVGTRCNRDGIGSRVTVTSPRGLQIREVEGGKGTGSQHWLPVQFGFGDYNGPVDVEVRNSCGGVVRKTGVTLDQMMTVTTE
jgi:tetratricopeptide (TPR) repeat protein